MTVRAKVLIGVLCAALAIGAVALFQERRQLSILEGVRGALAVGDPREKVERVLREQGLRPEFSENQRSYTAHVWFHFRPDAAVTVLLDDRGKVRTVSVSAIE